jgi:hypothetical protein
MERLTKIYNYISGWVEGKAPHFVVYGYIGEHNDINTMGDYYTGVAIDKLAEYENFMEENGFESLEDIKQRIKNMESDHELLINDFEEETKRLQKEIKRESDARKRFVVEVAKFKKQLAEKDKLLENAIVPKFKSGTTLYSIEDNSWICHHEKCVPVLFNNKFYYAFNIENENDLISDYGMEQNLIKEEDLYLPKKKAEEALKKLNKE